MSTPEGKIQLAILKYLRANGIMCWRNQPMTYNAKLGIHISNPYVMKGTPDIICILKDGVFCGIEVKTTKGRLSPDQILFEKRATLLGARYIVARSVEDVKQLVVPLR